MITSRNPTIDTTTKIGYTDNKGGIPMFIYENNEQINTELKVLYVRENTSGTKVAEKLGMSQQNFAKIVKKKNLAFSDIQKILDILGYDLEINFRKRT